MNQRLKDVKGSASVSIMQKAVDLKKRGIDVIDLAGGEPDFDTPDKIKSAAIDALKAGHTHYTVGKGLMELRVKIAEKLLKDNSIQCVPENIIVTPGGKYGIYLAISALINPGDEVLILAPYWVSYEPIVRLCGGIPIIVNLDSQHNYMIVEQDILLKITSRTKLMIINYPNNPTGRILHQNEAEILKKIILETGIYVLSDEIYERIVFDGKESISLASDKKIAKNVITVNGFSKSVAMTGWRLGYVTANQELIGTMYKIFVHSITGVSTFIQEAAIKAFDCNSEIEAMRMEYEKRREFIVGEINRIPKMECMKPEGGFYLWIQIDTDKSSQEVCDYLLNSIHLVAVPGEAYGENKKCYIRICFAHDINKLEKVVEKLKKIEI